MATAGTKLKVGWVASMVDGRVRVIKGPVAPAAAKTKATGREGQSLRLKQDYWAAGLAD